MSKRVLFLLNMCQDSWTSREDFHCRLCSALQERGDFGLLVLTGMPPSEVTDRFRAANVGFEVLPYFGLSYSFLKALRSTILKHKISTVHIRYYNYFSALPWLTKYCGVENIIYTEANGGEWQRDLWNVAPVRLRTWLATSPVRHFIAVSEFIKRRLVAVGVNRTKVSVVYNGIDTRQFHADPGAKARFRMLHNMGEDELLITTMGALIPLKRPQVAIQTMGVLAKRGLAARLAVVGQGPMRPELEQLARDLGVAERILWCGASDTPWLALQASDLFVLTTIGEAFGFVVAEAMACEVPVVAGRSGAMPELLTDGKTGLLADSEDPEDFAQKLLDLAEDVELRRCIGTRAADEARTRFDVEQSVRSTLALYDALL